MLAGSSGYSWSNTGSGAGSEGTTDWKVISGTSLFDRQATATATASASSGAGGDQDQPDQVKIVVLGAPGVGKTAIINVRNRRDY